MKEKIKFIHIDDFQELLVFPNWLPLFDEGRHSLLSVLGGEGRVEEPLLGREALGQGCLEGRVRRLLANLEQKTAKSQNSGQGHKPTFTTKIWVGWVKKYFFLNLEGPQKQFEKK